MPRLVNSIYLHFVSIFDSKDKIDVKETSVDPVWNDRVSIDVYDKFDNDPIKIWFIFSNSASNDFLLIDLKPTMILRFSRLFNESIS